LQKKRAVHKLRPLFTIHEADVLELGKMDVDLLSGSSHRAKRPIVERRWLHGDCLRGPTESVHRQELGEQAPDQHLLTESKPGKSPTVPGRMLLTFEDTTPFLFHQCYPTEPEEQALESIYTLDRHGSKKGKSKSFNDGVFELGKSLTLPGRRSLTLGRHNTSHPKSWLTGSEAFP